jgi:hypothetical protein
MLRGRSGYVLWIMCSLFATGCDPVRTTSQPVRLRVVDSASGQPVVGAHVSLKDDRETAEALSPDDWHQPPWFSDVTDKRGEADIDVKYTALDRTRGSRPPSGRDWVTGIRFLVRVKQSQQPEEELSVVMNLGASVKGKSYTVTVIDIQEPRYVRTDE